MPTELLEEKITLIDPNKLDLYTNLPIRPDAREGFDYQIINEDIWNFFYGRYGGIPLTRYTSENTSDGSIMVDLWFKEVIIFHFNLISRSKYWFCPFLIKNSR